MQIEDRFVKMSVKKELLNEIINLHTFYDTSLLRSPKICVRERERDRNRGRERMNDLVFRIKM